MRPPQDSTTPCARKHRPRDTDTGVPRRKWLLHAALLLTAALGFVSAAQAQGFFGTPITVRLIAASTKPGPDDSRRLKDVLPLLQGNLRFQSYDLVSTRKLRADDGTSVNLGRDLRLTLSDVDGLSMVVQLVKGRKTVVQTRLALRKNRPVLLGGIPSSGDEQLIVVIQSP